MALIGLVAVRMLARAPAADWPLTVDVDTNRTSVPFRPAVGLRTRFNANLDPAPTFVLLGLLTLIVILYDRYRAIRQASGNDGELVEFAAV